MRPIIKDFATIIATTIPVSDPIFEFGSYQVAGQENIADLRHLFSEREYIGADMRAGPGVDIVLNLHDIDLPSDSVGTVLCFDTLEHVEDPRRAMLEIHRVLKPDGIAVISSVMKFPIHDYPHDYWRFTPEAFRSILKPFSESFVGFSGAENFPRNVVGIGFKGKENLSDEFMRRYKAWQAQGLEKEQERQRKIYNAITSNPSTLRQLIPPILYPHITRLYKAIFRSKKHST